MAWLSKPVVVMVGGVMAVAAALPLASCGGEGSTSPATGPTSAPATAATKAASAPVRDIDAVMADMDAVAAELSKVVASPAELLKEGVRKEAGPKAIPILRRMVALTEEAGKLAPMNADYARIQRMQFMGLLALAGDGEAVKTLEAEANGGNEGQAVAARMALALAHWWENTRKPADQEKVIAEVRKVAQGGVKDEEPVLRAVGLMVQIGPATPQQGREAEDIIVNDLKGDMAKKIAEQIVEERNIREEYENKPVVIADKTVDGKEFTTADWKGKVVLVDFWATWCDACLMELPQLKALYDKYHKEGLEIVGVSSDRVAGDLTGFLKETKELTWPVLFDAANPGQHALAKKFGVHMYPTYFLIDRKGVLRDMDGWGKLDEEIPSLLGEK